MQTKAEKREKKKRNQSKMHVSGRSVFTIAAIIYREAKKVNKSVDKWIKPLSK